MSPDPWSVLGRRDRGESWWQGYYEARHVLMGVTASQTYYRSPRERDRLAAIRFDHPGDRRRGDVLDFIDGAWHFLMIGAP